MNNIKTKNIHSYLVLLYYLANPSDRAMQKAKYMFSVHNCLADGFIRSYEHWILPPPPPPLPTNKPKYIYFFTITSLSSSYSISPLLLLLCCPSARSALLCITLHHTQSLPLTQTHVVWLEIFLLLLLAPQANQRISQFQSNKLCFTFTMYKKYCT